MSFKFVCILGLLVTSWKCQFFSSPFQKLLLSLLYSICWDCKCVMQSLKLISQSLAVIFRKTKQITEERLFANKQKKFSFSKIYISMKIKYWNDKQDRWNEVTSWRMEKSYNLTNLIYKKLCLIIWESVSH